MAGSGEPVRREANKQKLKNELDNLMTGFNETFAGKSDNANASDIIGKKLDEIARPAKIYDYDMDALDIEFKQKATLLIDSMFKLYLDAGIIDKVDYSKRKKDLDTSNLANMLWQLKTVKITITVLMDEVLSGNTDNKTVAALSDMQSRFSEIIRMQANYVMFLEDSYKKMKYDNIEALADPGKGEEHALAAAKKDADDSEYFLTANPKELIKQITEVSPLTDEEHLEMKKDGEDCISDIIGTKNTDPKLKEELMVERNIEVEKKETGDKGYDSILNMI